MNTILKGKKHFAKKISVMKNKKPTELTVGDRLALLRIENGYNSQEKFGELFSLSKSAINNYENDSARPDFDTIKLIAERFNVSYDYLFGYSDSKIRENHDTVNKLGISENAVKRLIEFGNTKEYASIVSYLLESDLMPTLVELIKRYVMASVESLDVLGCKDMSTLISADSYLSGITNEEFVRYALIHCFTDIIENSPSIAGTVELRK